MANSGRKEDFRVISDAFYAEVHLCKKLLSFCKLKVIDKNGFKKETRRISIIEKSEERFKKRV